MDAVNVWSTPGAYTPEVTYKWNFGDFTGGTSQSESHSYTSAGTYIVSLSTKDATGCPNIVKETIVVSNVTASIESESVKCFNANNGSITVTATGGVEPYSYSIDGGTSYNTTGMFTDLNAGSYTVIVTDAISCESSAQNVVLTQPASELVFSTSQENVVCSDDANGSITITATGGTAPYTYDWGAGGNTGLSAGTYTVTVSDANACSFTASSFRTRRRHCFAHF